MGRHWCCPHLIIFNKKSETKITHLFSFDFKYSDLAITMNSMPSIDLEELPENQIPVVNPHTRIHLATLKLTNMKLDALPDDLSKLIALREITITHNPDLKSVPSFINARELKKLNLGYNGLEAFPEWIGSMKNLVELNLERNNLKRIPNSIDHATSLVNVYLSGNQIRELPRGLRNLTHVRHIELDGNPLQSLFPFNESQLMNITTELPTTHLVNDIIPAVQQCNQKTPADEKTELACRAVAQFYRESIDDLADKLYMAVPGATIKRREFIRLCHEGKGHTHTAERLKQSKIRRDVKDALSDCWK